MSNDKLLNCITESDKEEILILLDDSIRNEKKRISEIRNRIETHVFKGIIDFDNMEKSEEIIDLHEERIIKIKQLIKKLESCK